MTKRLDARVDDLEEDWREHERLDDDRHRVIDRILAGVSAEQPLGQRLQRIEDAMKPLTDTPSLDDRVRTVEESHRILKQIYKVGVAVLTAVLIQIALRLSGR